MCDLQRARRSGTDGHSVRDAAESELDLAEEPAEAPAKREELRPRRTNVWQDTFSPQMNSNMRRLSADYYDAPKSGSADKSVWEHIVKADTIRHAAFDHFDTNSACPAAAALPA